MLYRYLVGVSFNDKKYLQLKFKQIDYHHLFVNVLQCSTMIYMLVVFLTLGKKYDVLRALWVQTRGKIIYTYTHCNLWRHRQFITIFYQFLHIRIEIIHGSHMFLPRVGLYVSFLPLADARGKTSWHKGQPVVKTIYTYGFHELFLKYFTAVAFISVGIIMFRQGPLLISLITPLIQIIKI